MNRFGTRHIFTYPTAFIDQMDERSLLAKKENPVALAVVCATRMMKTLRDERKRYQYAKELLTILKSAGYSLETAVGLMQFIEGMTDLSTPKLKSALKNDLEQGITAILGEGTDMIATVRTPILRKILRKKAQEMFKAEGKTEGILERKLEDARRMLSRGIELAVVADVTELSEKEIRKQCLQAEENDEDGENGE
jgi:predicted transposase/invertase (TIGR01784 family)